MKLLQFALILLTLALAACTTIPSANPTANSSSTATRPTPATRVVALTPITADIIHRQTATTGAGCWRV